VPAPNREAGARVREARQAAGLSREELADLLELSVSRVAQMESGYIRDQKADHILSRIAAASGNSSAPETPREAGLRLREFRKSVGLSVKEAAGLLGLKHTTLAHLESGYISGKHADELIEKLQVSAAEAGSRAFDPKKAGAQIRQERIRAGLSQKELGTILRLPLPRISLIELGNVTEPEAKNILRRIHGKPVREIKTRKVRQSDQVLLGSNIRDAREAAGLSQKALGNMLQLPQTRVSLIERGKVDEATGKKILQMLTALSENQDERKAIPDPVLTAARPARARKSRNPELGRKIQEARQAAGLSQKALASLLGLSQGSISYMEQGRVDEETAERVLTLIARPSAD
jgi:transcriptional regulator with XRE-family HTH domain